MIAGEGASGQDMLEALLLHVTLLSALSAAAELEQRGMRMGEGRLVFVMFTAAQPEVPQVRFDAKVQQPPPRYVNIDMRLS